MLYNHELLIITIFKGLKSSSKWVKLLQTEFLVADGRIPDATEEQLKCGLYFSHHLAQKIEATFGHNFNVILSYNKEHCFIRFHKVRINEKWLDDNLDNYKLEAILLITT
jgi:hypothetical protein